MKHREVVFVDGARTAFGTMGRTLKHFTMEELGGLALKGLVEKTRITERAHVDTVFAGSAIGGTSACKFSMATEPFRMIPPLPVASSLSPAKDPATMNMGLTAEALQQMYNISRQEQDEFGCRSQALARKAIDAGYFVDEIVSVTVPTGKKSPPLEFKADEHRRETSMEALAALPPAFIPNGTVTAGNASGRNDGAAFVLMMTKEKALALGYTPIAKWLSGGDIGVDPKIMGIAPAYAIPQVLKRAGLKLADIAVMECNEAFAVQNLAVIKELENQTVEKIDMEKNWNPNGGAIAYGHPI